MYFQAWHGRKQAAWAIKATPARAQAQKRSKRERTTRY